MKTQQEIDILRFGKDLQFFGGPGDKRGNKADGAFPTVEGQLSLVDSLVNNIMTEQGTLISRTGVGTTLTRTIEAAITPTHLAAVANEVKRAMLASPHVQSATVSARADGNTVVVDLQFVPIGQSEAETLAFRLPEV